LPSALADDNNEALTTRSLAKRIVAFWWLIKVKRKFWLKPYLGGGLLIRQLKLTVINEEIFKDIFCKIVSK
jgi:hypothetical protein